MAKWFPGQTGASNAEISSALTGGNAVDSVPEHPGAMTRRRRYANPEESVILNFYNGTEGYRGITGWSR